MFSVLALIVVRLVAVPVALVVSGLPSRSGLFIGWFGPRGIGTLVLGLLMVGRGEIQQSVMITQAVVVTVAVSLVMHSLTYAARDSAVARAVGGELAASEIAGS